MTTNAGYNRFEQVRGIPADSRERPVAQALRRIKRIAEHEEHQPADTDFRLDSDTPLGELTDTDHTASD